MLARETTCSPDVWPKIEYETRLRHVDKSKVSHVDRMLPVVVSNGGRDNGIAGAVAGGLEVGERNACNNVIIRKSHMLREVLYSAALAIVSAIVMTAAALTAGQEMFFGDEHEPLEYCILIIHIHIRLSVILYG